MIEILFFGFIAACVSLFINYIIGKPGGEFSPYEIFSFYTVWLSKMRLKRVGLYKQYIEQYNDSFLRLGLKCSSGECKNDYRLIELKNDMAKVYYNAADPFFTWERALGMCSICTGFWISIIIGLLITRDISEIIEIIVISHVTIRLLSKII